MHPALRETDPEIAQLILEEERRERDTIRLIPSENYVSHAVLSATGSVLTNKYSEGYPGKRYYEGQKFIDPIETLAIERAKTLFGAEHANVQPYSGSPCNLAVYLAFLKPGDTVMGMSLPHGGHLTHGWNVSVTGKWFRSVSYGVSKETGRIALDEVREVARRERPKLIFCGGTAIPRTIDFAGFAEVAAEVDALLVADIAHIAGLVAGGAHPTPVGHAPVITTTTHKTLRGPRGAMILTDEEHAKPIDRAVFPGLQGGPHNHTTAAIAVALHEASTDDFRSYAARVVANAAALTLVTMVAALMSFATLMPPICTATRSMSYVVAAKSDLRNLVAAQHEFREKFGRFADGHELYSAEFGHFRNSTGVRVYIERAKPNVPDAPLVGVSVLLLPHSDERLERLELLKRQARETMRGFRAAAPSARALLEGYEVQLWEAGYPEAAVRTSTDGGGAFRVEIPAGAWLLIAERSIFVPVQSARGGGAPTAQALDPLARYATSSYQHFLPSTRLIGYDAVTMWLRELTVESGQTVSLDLHDRGVWLSGIAEESDTPRRVRFAPGGRKR